MKKLISLILIFSFLGFVYQSHAQVQYNNCNATGANASAIGNKTTASGNNSLAGGYTTQATGSNSLAFGYNSKATQSTTTAIGNTATASGIGSMALGNYVKATAQNAFVFGSGTTASYPLTNSTANSIAFGVNSNKPTLLITKSLNNNFTGKVAIGPVTSPQAKLHILSDSNEDAGIMIETNDKSGHKAFITLFDDTHSITVDNTATMELHAGTGTLKLQGGNYCFGTGTEKKARLYTNGTPSFYINATRIGNNEMRELESTSYAIDFNEEGVIIRTALNQAPRGSVITNWKEALLVCTDGKIGIGSRTTYIKNDLEKQLEIHAPHSLNMDATNITLTGKIGINTVNEVNGYALAVDGGIISTKVYIKEVKQWPDYVFDDDYTLMDLEELKHYIAENRHLPGLPSENEILNNGYDMNEMQCAMLQKIEELTQYILLLQEEIEELKQKNDTIVFTYDSNGNRITRSLLFERIINPEFPNATVTSSAYTLFPNPTYGKFSLQLNNDSENTSIRATLLNISGTILEVKELEENIAIFDLSRQPGGIYLLEVEGPNGHETWRIIKQ